MTAREAIIVSVVGALATALFIGVIWVMDPDRAKRPVAAPAAVENDDDFDDESASQDIPIDSKSSTLDR